MFKLQHRLLALLLCTVMLCTMSGFTFIPDAHDVPAEDEHDHGEEVLSVFFSSPVLTATLSSDGGDVIETPTPPEPTPETTPDPGNSENPSPDPNPSPTPGGENYCPNGPGNKHEWSRWVEV